MSEDKSKVTIDGTEYLVSDLSKEAKAQIQSLKFVDTEIGRLNAKLAITNTARIAYLNALKTILEEKK